MECGTLKPAARRPSYYLYRARLEMIAERKVRRRQLTEDGNIEITGRDLRQREFSSSPNMHAQAA